MKTINKLSIALVFLGAFGVSGCTNLVVGHPIKKAKIDEIVPGETTKEDIGSDAWFGKPLHVVTGPDGEIWVYRYMTGNERVDELSISFAEGTVSCFYKE